MSVMVFHALGESFSEGEMKFPAALLITTWVWKRTQHSCDFKTQYKKCSTRHLIHILASKLFQLKDLYHNIDFQAAENGTYVHQEAQHQQPAGLQQPVQSLGPSHYTAQHEPATCTTSLSIMGVKIHRVKLRHWSTTMQNNVSNKSHFIALNQCFCF